MNKDNHNLIMDKKQPNKKCDKKRGQKMPKTILVIDKIIAFK